MAVQDPSSAPPSQPSESWFRRVAFYSILSALAPLIPIPYLDDRVLEAIRRRMIEGLLRERGVVPNLGATRVLSEGWKPTRGCLSRMVGLLFALTLKLVGRLVRKLVVFLTFKQCADEGSKSLHLGYLVHHATRPEAEGLVSAAPGGGNRAPRVTVEGAARFHGAMTAALREVDHRPIEGLFKRAFHGSRRMLVRAARALMRRGAEEAASDPVVQEQESRLGGVVDRLMALLEAQRGYFMSLERHFDKRFEGMNDSRESTIQ